MGADVFRRLSSPTLSEFPPTVFGGLARFLLEPLEHGPDEVRQRGGPRPDGALRLEHSDSELNRPQERHEVGHVESWVDLPQLLPGAVVTD